MVDKESITVCIAALENESNWDLNARNLSDDDIKILADVLQTNQNCCVLHLHLNSITDDGMDYLAEMLKTNRTVTDLYLGANDIGNRGVDVLCHTLAHHNRTLALPTRQQRPSWGC